MAAVTAGSVAGAEPKSLTPSSRVCSCSCLQPAITPDLLAALQLSAHPSVAGTAYAYVFAELVGAAVWQRHLAGDPLAVAGGAAVRRQLLQPSAAVPTQQVVEALLGAGSMRAVVSEAGEVVGWIPRLEHAAYQDIALWG